MIEAVLKADLIKAILYTPETEDTITNLLQDLGLYLGIHKDTKAITFIHYGSYRILSLGQYLVQADKRDYSSLSASEFLKDYITLPEGTILPT